jgi:hypothetical protein
VHSLWPACDENLKIQINPVEDIKQQQTQKANLTFDIHLARILMMGGNSNLHAAMLT